jgi:hypothetical protein
VFLSKFLKFFLFYNFTHYTHLNKRRSFPDNNVNFLSIIYFKFVADFFTNPAHPFPVEVEPFKDYTKHFGFLFHLSSTKYEGKLNKFKKMLSHNLAPKIYKKRKTFRKKNSFFNKHLSLAFTSFVKKKLPSYCNFIKSCLPKSSYEDNEALIKAYFVDRHREKLAYFSRKFIIHPFKSIDIRSRFFMNIEFEYLSTKKLNFMLQKFFLKGLNVKDSLKKYTKYKRNRPFPSYFLEKDYFYAPYINFIRYVKFFVYKKKNMKLPKKAIENLKILFQKLYLKHKSSYLRRNKYLTILEKFNLLKDTSLKKQITKKFCKKKLKQLSNVLPLEDLNNFANKLIKVTNLLMLQIKSVNLASMKHHIKNYRRGFFKPKIIKYKKNNVRLTKFYFIKLFKKFRRKKFKKKVYRVNFFYRLNLFRRRALKKNNLIFNLRKRFIAKRVLNSSKLALGWFIVNKRFQMKFLSKHYTSLFLLPRLYFLYFPSFTVGNRE